MLAPISLENFSQSVLYVILVWSEVLWSNKFSHIAQYIPLLRKDSNKPSIEKPAWFCLDQCSPNLFERQTYY